MAVSIWGMSIELKLNIRELKLLECMTNMPIMCSTISHMSPVCAIIVEWKRMAYAVSPPITYAIMTRMMYIHCIVDSWLLPGRCAPERFALFQSDD